MHDFHANTLLPRYRIRNQISRLALSSRLTPTSDVPMICQHRYRYTYPERVAGRRCAVIRERIETDAYSDIGSGCS
jgi:hypothetical protein